MNSSEVIFDDNLEFYTSVDRINEICVILSDDLISSEEELTDKYKKQIAEFITNYTIWNEKAIFAITEWAKKMYNIIPKKTDLQLMNIFILFEQNDKELYGLQYRVAFDVEHGCGLKINCDGFKIVEIGGSEVAFC